MPERAARTVRDLIRELRLLDGDMEIEVNGCPSFDIWDYGDAVNLSPEYDASFSLLKRENSHGVGREGDSTSLRLVNSPNDSTSRTYPAVIGRREIVAHASIQCPECGGTLDTDRGTRWEPATMEFVRWTDVPCDGCDATYTVEMEAPSAVDASCTAASPLLP